MPSRIPALIDWLVANLTAVGETSDPAFVVYDGPVTTDANEKQVLWVGLQDPNSESPEEAATSSQSREGLSQTARLEETEIRCAAEVWSGDNDVRTVRNQAFALLDIVENAVRSDTTQFGGAGQLASPGVTGISLVQDNPQQGAVARVSFAVLFTSFT